MACRWQVGQQTGSKPAGAGTDLPASIAGSGLPMSCRRANARSRRPHRISEAAINHLKGYAFPGNVRELENLVEQAAALAENEELAPHDFPLKRRADSPLPQAAAAGVGAGQVQVLADAVSDAERRAINAALEKSPNDLAQVADLLGVSATTLWRKMKRLGLKTTGEEPVAS